MALYEITTERLTIYDVMRQVRAIKEFPATVHIYDRYFVLSNKEEAWAICTGLELGFFLWEVKQEALTAKPL